VSDISKRALEEFVANSPAAVAMFDQDMRYMSVSEQWKSDYDLSGDLIGRSHYELFPELPDEWKDAHGRGMAGETVSRDQDPYVREDGSVQWLQWVVWPWGLSGEGAGGIIIFAVDSTDPMTAADDAAATPGPAAQTGQPAVKVAAFNEHLCRNNMMLNLLPRRLLDLLMPELRPVTVGCDQVLIEGGASPTAVLFPLSGLNSVVRSFEDGATYEVMTRGRTCIGGISVLFGDTALESDTVALMDGTALSMRPQRLRELMDSHHELHAWIERFAAGAGMQVQRSEGCYARHSAQQRLARWLLSATELACQSRLPISQERLANLLGVRRAGVSELMGVLRDEGIVETTRSMIAITDRKALAARACECYEADRQARAAIFGDAATLGATISRPTSNPADSPPAPPGLGAAFSSHPGPRRRRRRPAMPLRWSVG